MGRDKVGNYTFVLNMTIQYKVWRGFFEC
jgi:hypothetical protein